MKKSVTRASLRAFLRDNGLTLAFGTAFLLALSGQAVVGHIEFNDQLAVDDLYPVSFGSI